MTPWWVAVAPAEAELECGGERHRVVWDAGRLCLPDHGDPDAERALGALGARRPRCVVVKDAWEARAGDVGLVTLGRRPGEAGLGLRDGAPRGAAVAPSPGGRGAATAAGDARRDQLLALLALPVALVDRLVLGAFAAAAERWADEQYRVVHGLRLGAALAARATPALRRLGAAVAGGAPVVVNCAPATDGGEASVAAERSGAVLVVTATLPLAWVASVWGAGVSEPGGRFVLAIEEVGAGEPGGVGVAVAEWEPAGAGAWVAARRPARLARGGDGLLQLV